MWLLQSRKAQVALGSIVTILLARLLPRLGFTPTDVNVISGAIVALGSIWIGGIAHEDAAAKSSPVQQTNIGSDVKNTGPPPLATAIPDAPFTTAQLHSIEAYLREQHAARVRAQAAQQPPPSPQPTPGHP